MNYRNKNIYLLTLALLSMLSIVLVYSSGDAKVTGNCANCHTMHASQNGTSGGIAYGGSSLPQPTLLRGDCFGCHGQGTSNKIVTIGGSEIPQVYHTDGSGDLAGGNFAYILGAKGSGASDAKGHNVIEIGNQEDILAMFPPPGFPPAGAPCWNHVVISLSKTNFTCAGYHGCHGSRQPYTDKISGLPALKGAHHQNVDGKCDNPTDNYNSYRFLRGVKGLENTGTYKWQNANSSSHNEYFGATTPMGELGGPPSCFITCSRCHNDSVTPRYIRPENNTISGFCATCHGLLHSLQGIGGDTSSPFTRHPTDVILPNSGEYSAYTTYSVEAPVARQTVFDSISSTVTPGTDVVMCLSCHAAHATNYPDILRWNYSIMIAGGGGSGGCFTCHTQKNTNP